MCAPHGLSRPSEARPRERARPDSPMMTADAPELAPRGSDHRRRWWWQDDDHRRCDHCRRRPTRRFPGRLDAFSRSAKHCSSRRYREEPASARYAVDRLKRRMEDGLARLADRIDRLYASPSPYGDKGTTAPTTKEDLQRFEKFVRTVFQDVPGEARPGLQRFEVPDDLGGQDPGVEEQGPWLLRLAVVLHGPQARPVRPSPRPTARAESASRHPIGTAPGRPAPPSTRRST